MSLPILPPLGMLGLASVCIALIFAYRAILRHMDPLAATIVPKDRVLRTLLSGWAASHFLFFMLLGTLYPDCFIPAMLLGSLWEVFEFWWAFGNPWWFANVDDIVVDAIGFLTGSALVQLGAEAGTNVIANVNARLARAAIRR
jgi:hypothetical protein